MNLMRRNNPVKIALTFRAKIALVSFGIFLFFVLLEIGLRLGGFLLLSVQEYRNMQSIKQKGAYRILCLGESTTQGQYPPFLEQALNQRNIGVRFSVVDKGSTGTNTRIILSQVKSYLNEYHPDMVVTMMGINDEGGHLPLEAGTTSRGMFFFRSLRTYKLSELLWLHILVKAKEMGFYRTNEGSGFSRQLSGIESIETPIELISTEDAFKKALERDSANYNLYVELGKFYRLQGRSLNSEQMLKKALELNPKNDHAYIELGRLYLDQDKYLQAQDAFKKVIKLNPENAEAYYGLGILYLDQDKYLQAQGAFKKVIDLNPKEGNAYRAILGLYEKIGEPKLAKEYARKANKLKLEYYLSTTVNNYRKLKEILDKRRISLVCVQYPLRNVEPLKKIFVQDEGVIFVDNESVFKKALKKASYKWYFKDMFAGEFGHCTEKGNRLLAENIAQVILKEVFNK